MTDLANSPVSSKALMAFLAGCSLSVSLWAASVAAASKPLELPYESAGLTERQAVAHALDRLGYGARPGEVDRVMKEGLELWLGSQLRAEVADPVLVEKLGEFETLQLSAKEMGASFLKKGEILRRAVEAGVVERADAEAIAVGDARQETEGSERERNRGRLAADDRRKIIAWARKEGLQTQRIALDELLIQKLARARYSENQLQEVLVDFWFNHFNVSITDPQARIYVWPFERDAVRAHVYGSFRDMLEATARHPAMLHYLDNVRSVAKKGQRTTLDDHLQGLGRRGEKFAARLARRQKKQSDRPRGLNENYARELMELHTLGVDGGYDQQDVIEVARAFTGWTAYPPSGRGGNVEQRLEIARRYPSLGFVVQGAFLFRADVHDAEKKVVLGNHLAPGRGVEDGKEVLDILASHPSTARHLAGKLATRFVSDQPPASIVERLASVFQASGGDLRQMMVALVESPEFWAPEARQSKIKSPFELVVSALRAVGAEIQDPRAALEWISSLGQPLYAFQAPTGYPDRAQAWVNTGALLGRMNFGLQLATGRVPGVHVHLSSLLEGQEPAAQSETLRAFVQLLLPERDVAETVARLEPRLHESQLSSWPLAGDSFDASKSRAARESAAAGPVRRMRRDRHAKPILEIDDSPMAQVVGFILGSPDFQRR